MKQMTEEEKKRFLAMEQDIHSIKNKMDKILVALMGSDLSKDGGLVGRILDLEKNQESLEKEIAQIKKEKVKTELYVKVIWALIGAFGSGIFSYILTLLFKK